MLRTHLQPFRWRLGVLLLIAGLSGLIAGCTENRTAGTDTTGTVATTDGRAVLAATVVDTSPEGAVLLRTRSGQHVLLSDDMLDGDLAVGTTVNVPLELEGARFVALNDRMVLFREGDRLIQVPVEVLPQPFQARTRVRVQKPNGQVVEVPLNAAIAMREAQGAVILAADAVQDDGLVLSFEDGLIDRAVVVGDLEGDRVLVLSPVQSHVRLVEVPVARVQGIADLTPLEAVSLVALDGGLTVQPWTAARTAALVLDQALRLDGTLVDLAQAAALLTVDEARILVPQTLAFTVEGQEVAFHELQPGNAVTVQVPALTANVLALNDRVLTLESDDLGILQLPASAIPDDVLAQTRVTVPNPSGHMVTVPLTAALNMARGQAVLVDADRIQRLRPDLERHGIELGEASDIELNVRRRSDRDRDPDRDDGADLSPPGRDIAPAAPAAPPGQEATPGRGREGAPGPSIAPGRQDRSGPGPDDSAERDDDRGRGDRGPRAGGNQGRGNSGGGGNEGDGNSGKGNSGKGR